MVIWFKVLRLSIKKLNHCNNVLYPGVRHLTILFLINFESRLRDPKLSDNSTIKNITIARSAWGCQRTRRRPALWEGVFCWLDFSLLRFFLSRKRNEEAKRTFTKQN